MRHLPLVVLACAALSIAACGDSGSADRKTPGAPAAAGQDLGAIKTYLLDHTERLQADVGKLRQNAEAYHELAAATGFDDKRLLAEHPDEVAKLMTEAKATFKDANPAYEEMEGVVAGVPELADYDVIIDAGADGSDPENAVPFDVKTPAGKTFKQPGNYNYLIEKGTAVSGSEASPPASMITS